ncbi:hypothetical protein CSA56_16935 [candidate division KSB3 bacterium]|uniref:Uncharacterized protein n=1 Tax=candidate division KSB3 bacterium TaxID=2044937 RepID=A0A2G6K8E2_9BACT|nr:MAG: hypothetical protein CSA56_16935 [candidate division KSB3 bacterium]
MKNIPVLLQEFFRQFDWAICIRFIHPKKFSAPPNIMSKPSVRMWPLPKLKNRDAATPLPQSKKVFRFSEVSLQA